ncbi:MAG: polyphosphate polymerase domain-containing protein [Anaerolineales bacterium]|nr:polyphosphate polymerase domain-containing protein [Anaerolineales bacterium]
MNPIPVEAPTALSTRPTRPARTAAKTRSHTLPIGLTTFDPITLAEMDAVALLSRSDTKYLLRVEQLTEALPLLSQHYRVLEVKGARLSPYHTLYFDTPEFELFRWHHAGGRNRYKVRSRRYVQTNASFFEVKHKLNRFQTIKERIATHDLVTCLTPEALRFLRERLPAGTERLQPKLWNLYGRITLVNRFYPERVTLDLDLRFNTNDQSVALPGVVTAEVKQAGRVRPTAFVQLMHRLGIRAGGFSKYCVGVSLLYPQIKHNNFLAQLRTVTALADGGNHGTH